MKTPKFSASSTFLGEFDVPCLVAELKNSDVPEVATQYAVESSEDPTFTVYLRVKNPKAMSRWMREKVEELFKRNGLTQAIVEGLKELDADGYDFLPESEQAFVKKHGYHPYVYIQVIVLDEIKEKVLIALRDNSVLSEHGITIHLKAGRWRFADCDPFIRYQSAFEKYRLKAEFQKSDEMLQFEREWDELFPPPAQDTPVESPGTILCGVWEINKDETQELLKRLNCSTGQIVSQESAIEYKIGLWFSTEAIEELSSGYTTSISTITNCERRGNWFALQARRKEGSYWEPIYWCDGERLIEERGVSVFTRVTDACRKGHKRTSW